MTTLDYLNRWLGEGKLSAAQHDAIAALVRKDRVSVFVELNAVLYLGVLAFAAGLAWTANVHAAQWGDAAILIPATAILAGCLHYCFSRVPPYSSEQVPAPNFAFDYVLYLACLVFAVELGYIEYRFHLLQARWDYYLLASAVAYLALAYRFDNRFVLSLGIATLGSWFGVRFSQTMVFFGDPVRSSAMAYGAIVALLGFWTHAIGLKRHFLESYLHVAVNVVLAALVSGVFMTPTLWRWSVGLLAASAASVAGGVRYRRFAFVVYGVCYGYLGISRELLRGVPSLSVALLYVVVSAGAIVVGLVALSRRFGSEA